MRSIQRGGSLFFSPGPDRVRVIHRRLARCARGGLPEAAMVEDLLATLTLLGIGDVVLVLAGRGSLILRVLFGIGAALRVTRPRRTMATVRANPLLQLTLLLLLIVMSGWLATVAQVGVNETARAIRFERSAAPDTGASGSW